MTLDCLNICLIKSGLEIKIWYKNLNIYKPNVNKVDLLRFKVFLFDQQNEMSRKNSKKSVFVYHFLSIFVSEFLNPYHYEYNRPFSEVC